MRLIHELSWLWKVLGISVVIAAIFVASAALICKAKDRKLSCKAAVLAAVLGVIVSLLAINIVACTPMPL